MRRQHRPGNLSVHHRKPLTLGGADEEPNRIYIPRHEHQGWHMLFENLDVQDIADKINSRFLDPEFEFVVQRRVPFKDHALHRW